MLNLKSYINFLSRNKLYTFINVLGLSVSLMFIILTASYIAGEHTTDHFHENADQIYVLGNDQDLKTAYRIGGHLESRYPDIEKTCAVLKVRNRVEVSNRKFYAESIAVDTSFFNMFSFKLKQGDVNQALVSRSSTVISERFAQKVFGNKDPIGQNIKVDDNVFIVCGVVENFENTALSYVDMIITVENMSYFQPWAIEEDLKERYAMIFIQTVKGSDLALKIDDILEYFKTSYGWYNNTYGDLKQVTLTPLKDLYFTSKYGPNGVAERGSKYMINILLYICGLILVFAIFNYINLTIAQTSFRAKEMATRRLLGASKHSIFLKLIFESFLLCGVSFLVGLFFALSTEPYFNNLIETDISIIDDFSIILLLFYLAFIVILGGITGLFPAIVVSRFKPIDVVKGVFTFKSKMIFSQLFIIIQNLITIIFIVWTITIVKQTRYMIDVDLGYNTEGILSKFISNERERDLFYNRLKSLYVVKSVGASSLLPIGINTHNEMYSVPGGDKEVELGLMACDSSTMEMFGFEILSDFKIAGNGVWANEAAVEVLRNNGGVSSVQNNRYNFMIKGVIKDFMMGTASQGGVSPMLFYVDDVAPYYNHHHNILIEINGDLMDAYREIEAVYKEITRMDDFDAIFLDQRIDSHFDFHRKMITILMIFTFVAIIISSLGLLAMSVYFVRQRSMEIAVRKVIGSTNSQVLNKLVWQFLRLVVIAFVIACPISWYTMSEILMSEAYRIDLSVWIFISAGAFAILISFITVYWHCSIAANENPTKYIKK